MNFAILIPARAGSKGVPRKNLRLLAGKPLLAYPIDAAAAAGFAGRIFVTTEDAEIADTATRHGAIVIERPAELAADETPAIPVICHAIPEIEKSLGRLDALLYLQATTPFVTPEDIHGVVEAFSHPGAEAATSVVRITRLHPAKLKKLEDGWLGPFFAEYPEIEGTRRQDLPPCHIRNGSMYMFRRELPMERNTLYGSKCRGYVMPEERSLEIDTLVDFQVAEFMISSRSPSSH